MRRYWGPEVTVKHLPILYIKKGCPWCIEALAFFSRHGIELEVRDVNADEAARRRMVEISGQTRTPTLEFGDLVVADFSVDEFLAKLDQAPEVKKELGLAQTRTDPPVPTS
jgi:glutaredoxin